MQKLDMMKAEVNMSDYSIRLGDSAGSGIHLHSQGELYPVILMYIGQEKVFTYANKVLPYSMKQQVLDAVSDGTQLSVNYLVPAQWNCILTNSIWL